MAAGEVRAQLKALLPRAIEAAEALAVPPRASPPDHGPAGRRDARDKSGAIGFSKGGAAACCTGCGAARGVKGGPLRHCLGCGAVTGAHYCGDACATAHWPAHRTTCKRVQRKRAAAAAKAATAAAVAEAGESGRDV
jgi:hypothetical protein